MTLFKFLETTEFINGSGAGIAQSVEALYFTTKLHTSSVQGRVQPGTKYLYGKNPLECVWFGCRLPVAVVSQA